MLAINETLLRGNIKVDLEASYISWTKNRVGQTGGGVATAVARSFMNRVGGAGEGVDGDEYLITRVATFKPALNVINCYGEQRKNTKIEVEEKWKRICKELDNIKARNEFAILTGDLTQLFHWLGKQLGSFNGKWFSSRQILI